MCIERRTEWPACLSVVIAIWQTIGRCCGQERAFEATSYISNDRYLTRENADETKAIVPFILVPAAIKVRRDPATSYIIVTRPEYQLRVKSCLYQSWTEPPALSHTSIVSSGRTCISINPPRCYKQSFKATRITVFARYFDSEETMLVLRDIGRECFGLKLDGKVVRIGVLKWCLMCLEWCLPDVIRIGIFNINYRML